MQAVHKRYSVACGNLLHFMEAPKRNKCPCNVDALRVTTEKAAPVMIDCHFATFIPDAQLPTCQRIQRIFLEAKQTNDIHTSGDTNLNAITRAHV